MSEPRKFVITPARRQNIIPLIGNYGLSGGGKTRSALILARGMVGPKGKIRVVDTENGRARIFAEKIPGGYDVLDLVPPFDPDSYRDALEFAAKDSDIVVVDSMSHEWEGEGGVLDWQEEELFRMAGDDYKKREACKMAAWIKPKAAHKRMMQLVTRYPVPLIVCMRGQKKTHIVKGEAGKKTEVFTDEFSSPIADPRFIFEMLINLEVYCDEEARGGFTHVRKITNEDLYACLPKPGEQITYAHGERLAAWCKNPTGSLPSERQTSEAKPDRVKLLTELRDASSPIHGWKKEHGSGAWVAARAKLAQYLVDENILSDTENLDDIPADRLKEVIEKTKTKLAGSTAQ